MAARTRGIRTSTLLLAVVGGVGLIVLAVLAWPLIFRSAPVNDVTVFVGDSYTHGTGASAPGHRWTSVLSAREHWTEVNLGQGGTGYVTTAGPSGCGQAFCGDYRSVLDAAVAEHPGRVVIAGGQNDFSAFARDPAATGAAILDTVTAFHARLPDAELVVVGPSTPGEVSPDVTAFDQVVRDAAAANGAHYVSLIDPPVITQQMVIADRAHVDDAGHAAIAERVADNL